VVAADVLLRVAATYPLAAHPAWWIVPVVLLAAAVFRRSRRWTGGRALRARIRADLARGEAAVRRVFASEAIAVEAGGATACSTTDTARSISISRLSNSASYCRFAVSGSNNSTESLPR
jgi:hypothetical protein